MVVTFRPDPREVRLLFQNRIDRSAFNQPLVIKRGGAPHPIVHIPGGFTHQPEPAPFDLKHVLEPGLYPAADRNVAAHLC